jgi:hypothetical protein
VDFESLSADLRSLQARALKEISAAADPASDRKASLEMFESELLLFP